MPYKKRVIRKARPKRFRRRYRRTTMTMVPVGLPNRYLTKMRYNCTFSLDPDLATQVKQFRLNSLFDPEYAAGGHQPTPFDQLSLFYKRFRVLSVKTVLQQLAMSTEDGTAAANSFQYGMIVQNDPALTAAMSWDSLMQAEKVTHYFKTAQFTDSFNSKAGTMMIKWSGKKYFGKGYITDNDYTCTSAANPVIVAYLDVFGVAPTGTSTAMYFNVWQEYIVLCSDPITQFVS